MPREITSYCQSEVRSRSSASSRSGVRSGPLLKRRRSEAPVAIILTCDPPTSITRIFTQFPPHGDSLPSHANAVPPTSEVGVPALAGLRTPQEDLAFAGHRAVAGKSRISALPDIGGKREPK